MRGLLETNVSVRPTDIEALPDKISSLQLLLQISNLSYILYNQNVKGPEGVLRHPELTIYTPN